MTASILSRAALIAAVSSASPLIAQIDQFAPFQPYDPNLPIPRDQVQGEIVNLETQLIKPIVAIENGNRIAVANDADQRVVFYDKDLANEIEVVVGQGPAALAEHPTANELWVSVRHQSSVVVIDTQTHQVTHVLRPPIPANAIGAGRASSPGGIAFAANKAFVASTWTDELLVYDDTTKDYLGAIALEDLHNGRQRSLNDPFHVVAFNGVVYATSHLSGNQTAPRNTSGQDIDLPAVNRSALGPDDIAIVDLNDGNPANLSLPDFDVALVDPVNEGVITMVSGIGSVLLGLEGHPQSGQLLVSALESFNTKVGEAAFPDGRVVENRLAMFPQAAGPVTMIATEFLGTANEHVVFPTDITVNGQGRVFVAGYSSANIGVWDQSFNYLGSIPTDAGPRGLAFSRRHNRLYCLNRAAGTVTAYRLNVPGVPVGPDFQVTLQDPTFDTVKQGRIKFLEPNSLDGTTNCMSCHIDGRKDGVGWNLSKNLEDDVSGMTPTLFRDRKGVMVTQDLRGLVGAAPYHWRGEQKDLEDFSGTFVNLLHGTEPSAADFQLMKDYMLSLEYPPNPFELMNRDFEDPDPGLAEPDGSISMIFASVCAGCHALPLGTNGDITDDLIGDSVDVDGNQTQISVDAMKSAQLRGLWTRESEVTDADSTTTIENMPVLGFGFAHEGMLDSLNRFVDEFFGNSLQGDPGVTMMADFLHQLDTGLAPATMFSGLLDVNTAGTATSQQLDTYLLQQARDGHCDVAARGQITVQGTSQEVGLLFDPGLNQFVVDDSTLGPFSYAQLDAMAALDEARLLILGVPVGSGARIGVDRDRDGIHDADEAVMGTSPALPDTDGDGLWDSYDSGPTNPNDVGTPAGAPIPSNVLPIYATTNAIKITYDTDTFSPTNILFREPGGASIASGDGVLPVFDQNDSNLWKRRHTAFVRPQPQAGVLALKPLQAYEIEIVTQGQNGQVGRTPIGTLMSLPNTADSFRVSAIGAPQSTNLGNDQFSYSITVTFEVTFDPDGSLNLEDLEIPGRFTIYDSNGGFIPVHVKATIDDMTKTATFTHVTNSGDQVSGDRVTFDVPMWVVTSSTVELVEFPGQWPDGPSFAEWTAP